MLYIANYEINSECSVVSDNHILKINHPKNIYQVKIKNIKRPDFTEHFRLSLHLYFDAPCLEESTDIANSYLADCLNMLALTTGSKFERHRIKQIVDATPNIGEMRSVLFWTDAIDHEDPQPFLNDNISNAIEKLSEHDMPPAVRRAMRWYRLGINADIPDDQFMYFWFAIEILAEHNKSSEKVPDKCSKCASSLYCESCKTHTTHRPYAKQAIRSLMLLVDKKCNEETVKLLDKTRNSLMHGATLADIEEEYHELEDHIVDILGKILFKALIFQFPHEYFDGSLTVGFPSTFVHRIATEIVHMQTIVPISTDGDFDLSFKGIQAQIVTFGPPQSALPTTIKISPEQYDRLKKISYSKSELQETFKRICQKVKYHKGEIYAQVLSTDMDLIKDSITNNQQEDWEILFQEILGSLKNNV